MKSFQIAVAALLAAGSLAAQNAGDWRYYGSDARSTKYSALDQINAGNVDRLQMAWRWKSDNSGPREDRNWDVTPLMVGEGLLHGRDAAGRGGGRRVTGETLWVYRINEGERGDKAARVVNRSVITQHFS